MADKRFYKGYSTRGTSDTRSWALYDMDLIKQDLLMHFHTRKGERVMRPEFGCSIWDSIGEQITSDLKEELREEVERIIDLDIRVVSKNISINVNDHTITILVDLFYPNFNQSDQLKLVFDQRQ